MFEKILPRNEDHYHFSLYNEMIYEMDLILNADMKSSEAMILAVMNAIFEIA